MSYLEHFCSSRDDFIELEKNTTLRETIVSMAVARAVVGAGLGGWMNDKFGRRTSLIIANVLFPAGAAIMAFAPSPVVIIVGKGLCWSWSWNGFHDSASVHLRSLPGKNKRGASEHKWPSYHWRAVHVIPY